MSAPGTGLPLQTSTDREVSPAKHWCLQGTPASHPAIPAPSAEAPGLYTDPGSPGERLPSPGAAFFPPSAVASGPGTPRSPLPPVADQVAVPGSTALCSQWVPPEPCGCTQLRSLSDRYIATWAEMCWNRHRLQSNDSALLIARQPSPSCALLVALPPWLDRRSQGTMVSPHQLNSSADSNKEEEG